MKKSSIILISAIGLLIIGAFIAPFMLMKEQSEKNANTITLAFTGEEVTIPIDGHFSEIETRTGESGYYIQRDDYSRSLSLEIIQCDSISSPLLVVDKSWAGNVTASVQDFTLSLTVDMKAVQQNPTMEYRVYVPSDNELIGRLLIPASTELRAIHSDPIDVTLRDFRNLDVVIPFSTDASLINCQVRSLTHNP